jgi:hypothetical protein
MKQETLEEAALKETKAYGYGKYQTTSERYVIRQAFINGAKWQEERVDELLNTLLNNNMCSVTGDELIEQFKKKGDKQ